MSIDLKRFHGIFFDESLDGLAAAERDLLAIETALNQGEGEGTTRLPEESVQSLFRAVHSLKGSAGSLGFDEIGALAHDFEDVLERLRQGRLVAAQIDVDVLFGGIDALRAMVLAARDESGPVTPSRVQSLRIRLRAMAEGDAAELVERFDDAPQDDADVGAPDTPSLQIRFAPYAGFRAAGHDPARYLALLARLGSTQVRGDEFVGYDITLQSAASPEAIRAEFEWVEELCELTIEPVEAEMVVATPTPDDAAFGGATMLGRLPVAAEKLDSLLEIAGNLLTTNASLQNAATRAGLAEDAELPQLLGTLRRHIQELQAVAASMRLTPAEVLFAPFQRLVRDVARRLGKEVRLITEGEGQLLDKSLVEALADPLAHLVRNAIGHGVETVATRAAAGKPSVATITLALERVGGQVVLSLTDDGAGIDPQRVRAAAIAKNLARKDEQRTDAAWLELIFAAGFSTASDVTDLSGRGVGLDAVHKTVNRLGGHLSLASDVGVGSRFAMRFPLTTAIIDAIVIENDGQAFALATDHIAACLTAARAPLRHTWGQTLLDWEGEAIPCASLSALYADAPSAQGERAAPAANEQALLILHSGARRAGLLVDRVLDSTQLVVKNLEKNLFTLPMVSTMTKLGDGRLVPILDVNALAARVTTQQRTTVH